jgi:hypothetical protein
VLPSRRYEMLRAGAVSGGFPVRRAGKGQKTAKTGVFGGNGSFLEVLRTCKRPFLVGKRRFPVWKQRFLVGKQGFPVGKRGFHACQRRQQGCQRRLQVSQRAFPVGRRRLRVSRWRFQARHREVPGGRDEPCKGGGVHFGSPTQDGARSPAAAKLRRGTSLALDYYLIILTGLQFDSLESPGPCGQRDSPGQPSPGRSTGNPENAGLCGSAHENARGSTSPAPAFFSVAPPLSLRYPSIIPPSSLHSVTEGGRRENGGTMEG